MPTIKEEIAAYNAQIDKGSLLNKPNTSSKELIYTPLPQEDILWSEYDKNGYIGEEVENRRSRNQDGLDKLGIGVSRLIGQTADKLGQAVGGLAGLLGVDNNYKAYGDLSAASWIAGASDNALAQFYKQAEEDLKQRTPLYNSLEDRDANKRNIFNNLLDADFWASDFVDGAAFLTSQAIQAYFTGGLMNYAGVGLKGAKILSALKPSANLAKTKVLVDQLGMTLVNTAGEALFEAQDTRNRLRNQLAQEKYGMNFEELDLDTQKELNIQVAPSAAKTFGLNLMALAPSNFLQIKSLFKTAGKFGVKPKGITSKGMNTVAKEYGKWGKFVNSKTGTILAETAKNIGSEGLWEENIQTAIQDIADTTGNIFDIPEIMTNNIEDFLTGENTEGSKSILLGSLLGGFGGARSGYIDHSRNKKAIARAIKNTNAANSNFINLNDIYETEEYEEMVDNKPVKKSRFKLDEQGQVIIDEQKLNAFIANRESVQFLDDIATLANEKGNETIYNLAKDAAISKWVKAHFETQSEELIEGKIKNLEAMTDEQLIAEGFNPQFKQQDIANLKSKVAQYKTLDNQINKSILTNDESESGIIGFQKRKNELFNIGARIIDITTEEQRLQKEKFALDKTILPDTLKEKEGKILDLKISELAEAKNKFQQEFGKISDINTGEKYFNNEWKSSITKKIKDFDMSSATIDDYNDYEQQEMFPKKLKNKLKNIDNEFLEQGVDFREQEGENVLDIIDEFIGEKLPISPKLKSKFIEVLNQAITDKKEEIDTLEESINDEQDVFLQSPLISAKDEAEIALEILTKKLAQIEASQESQRKDDTEKGAKQEVANSFLESNLYIEYQFKANENFDNIGLITKQIAITKNLIKILKEKQDKDLNEELKKAEEQLVKLLEIEVIVTERLKDRGLLQERLLEYEVESALSMVGLTKENNISNPFLISLIKTNLGEERLEEFLKTIKDLEGWAKYGAVFKLLTEFRESVTNIQKEAIKEDYEKLIQTFLETDVIQRIVKVKGEKQSTSKATFIKHYKDNPALFFKLLLTTERDNEDSPVYSYFQTQNLNKFLYDLDNSPTVEGKIAFEDIKFVAKFHQAIASTSNLISFLESEFNPEVEVITEKVFNKGEGISPTNEQLISIRQVVQFMQSKGSNKAYGNFAYLKGFAGTGKTSIVVKWVLRMLNYSPEEIYATGHNVHSSATINKITENPIAPLFSDLLTALKEDKLDKVKIILIDEIIGLTNEELELVNTLVNEYNKRNKTEIKILGLGDPTQITAYGSFSILEQARAEMFNMTIITPLTIRYRSNIQAIVEIQDLFMSKNKDITTSPIIVKHTEDNTKGVNGSLSEGGIEEMLKTKELNDGKTRVIVVPPNEVERWKQKNLGVEIVSYIDVQGRTIDEVYVAIPRSTVSEIETYNKIMYTATSRAVDYLFIANLEVDSQVDNTIIASEGKAAKENVERRTTFTQDRANELEQLNSEEEIVSTTTVDNKTVKKAKKEADKKAKIAKDVADKAKKESVADPENKTKKEAYEKALVDAVDAVEAVDALDIKVEEVKKQTPQNTAALNKLDEVEKEQQKIKEEFIKKEEEDKKREEEDKKREEELLILLEEAKKGNTPTTDNTILQKVGIEINKEYKFLDIAPILTKLGIKGIALRIFNLITKVVNNLNVTLVFSDNQAIFTKEGANAFYNIQENKIYLNSLKLTNKDTISENIVHEVVHSVTSYVIKIVNGNLPGIDKLTVKQKQAVKNLNVLLETLQKDEDFKNEYGVTTVDELLAKLTNESFVEKLKNKKFDEDTTFFEKIISYIADILGLNTTAYDITYEALEDLIISYNPAIAQSLLTQEDNKVIKNIDEVKHIENLLAELRKGREERRVGREERRVAYEETMASLNKTIAAIRAELLITKEEEPTEEEEEEEDYIPPGQGEVIEGEDELAQNVPILSDGVVVLKYPIKAGIEAQTQKNIPTVKTGDKCFYIPFKLRNKDYRSIGVFVFHKETGEYRLVAALSQEELINRKVPVAYIEAYKHFKDNLGNYNNLFTINEENGFYSFTNPPIIFAEGTIAFANKLQYVYDKLNTIPFVFSAIIEKFKNGFFSGTKKHKDLNLAQNSHIRIFTKKEIRTLRKGKLLIAGVPYIEIENPIQQEGYHAKTQYIELERKTLNSELHSFYTKPLKDFITNYKKLKEILPFSEDDLGEFINSSEGYLPKLMDKLNEKYKKNITLQTQIIDLRILLQNALHEELTDNDLIIRKGSFVQHITEPFITVGSNGKDIKKPRKVVSIENDIVIVETAKGKTESFAIEDLVAKPKRKAGPAQHAMNMIALGNARKGNLFLRSFIKSKTGEEVVKGKSILFSEDTDLTTIENVMDKYDSLSLARKRLVHENFKSLFNKELTLEGITEEEKEAFIELLQDRLTLAQLESILEEDSNGDIIGLRVPVPIKTTLAEKRINYSSFENNSESIEEMNKVFFEDKFKKVIPTQVGVKLTSINNKLKVTPVSKVTEEDDDVITRYLLDSIKSNLGEKQDTDSLLRYLKSLDKTLTAEEVKFVSAIELLRMSEGKTSLGFFRNGILYLAKDDFAKAYTNVGRHELFHRIFNILLTPAQQSLVYKKAIIEFNLPENSTIEEVEESLALKYQEWRNNDPVSSFFKILFMRIKKFLGMAVDIMPDVDTFFTLAESGFFTSKNAVKSTRTYADLLKDFGTIRNFKNAKLLILHELRKEKKKDDIQDPTYEKLPNTTRDIFLNIFNFFQDEVVNTTKVELQKRLEKQVLHKENVLKRKLIESEIKDIQDILEDNYMLTTVLSNPLVYKRLIEDMFLGLKINIKNEKVTIKEITENKSDTSDEAIDEVAERSIVESSWSDIVEEAELKNPEGKVPVSVRQFLALIIDKKEQVNPRFVFKVAIETLSNFQLTGSKAYVLASLKQRMDSYSTVNSKVKAVHSALITLITNSFNTEFKGKQLDFSKEGFVNENIFKFQYNGLTKYIKRDKGETNSDFFQRIEASVDSVSLGLLKTYFITRRDQTTLTELLVSLGSLYKQNPHIALKAYDGTNKHTFRSSVADSINNAAKDNLKNILIRAYNENVSIFTLFNIPKKGGMYGDEIKILNTFYEKIFGTKNINYFDSEIGIYDSLYHFLNNIERGIKAGKRIEEILENENANLTALLIPFTTNEDFQRANTYFRSDGKKGYLYILSSFGINVLQYLKSMTDSVHSIIHNRPSFLDSEFYKLNIFNQGANKGSKIFNIVNFDSTEQEGSSYAPIRYKDETPKQWLDRNFKAMFLSASKTEDSEAKTYVQQIITPSDKPNIISARVSLLNNKKIKDAIIDSLKQIDLRIRQNVETQNMILNPFEDLLERTENETNEHYADRIMNAMQERAIQLHKEQYSKNKAFDYEHVSRLANFETHSAEFSETENAFITFYQNFYINTYFLNQLILGDDAFFQNEFDIIKRMAIGLAPGYTGVVSSFALPETFRVVVLKDIIGEIGDDFIAFAKIHLKKFNLTDGQGFITPKRAADLRSGFGAALKLGSLIKGVHYEIDKYGIPRALKYASIELSDELVAMFPKLKELRRNMELYGLSEFDKNTANILLDKESLTKEESLQLAMLLDKAKPIDEAVFKSAFKAGSPKNLSDQNNITDANIVELQNINYRIQLNPEKDAVDNTTRYPSQIPFFVNFSGNNKIEAETLFTLQEKLIKLGLDSVKNLLRLGRRVSKQDKDLIFEQRQALKREVAKTSVETVQEKFLKDDEMSINMPFLVNNILTKFANIVSKATVGIRVPGSTLVLQSSYGITKEDGTELKWRDDEGCIEVIMPDHYKGKIQIGDKILFDTMVGFRVPSTELHSAVLLKVVGFYPGNKNAIIAPKEIVYFHGSDYDVDELHILRREVSTIDYNKSTVKGVIVGRDSKGKEIAGFEEKLIEDIEELKRDLKVKQSLKTNILDIKGLRKTLKDHLNLLETYYKNKLVDTFIEVLKKEENINLLNTPITTERFKGMGVEESSIFDNIAKLKGFIIPKPKTEDFTTTSLYETAVDEWIAERNKVIYKKRNLYDVEVQQLMHADNFNGSKLTGYFANMIKSIAYFFQSTTDNEFPTFKEGLSVELDGQVFNSFSYIEKISKKYDIPLISETIDTLINAAIDHVKEQILSIINFSNNTGGIAVSLIATGMELKSVVNFMLQPSAKNISKDYSYNTGKTRTLEEIDILIEEKTLNKEKTIELTTKQKEFKKEIAKLKEEIKKQKKEKTESGRQRADDLQEELEELLLKSEEVKNEKNELVFNIDDVKLTTEILESMINKSLSELTLDELYYQKYILLNVFDKMQHINKTLTAASQAYSVLKEMPTTYSEIETVITNFDELGLLDIDDNFIPSSDFAFSNVNPLILPHIKMAFEVLKFLKTKSEQLFYKHHKAVIKLSKQIRIATHLKLNRDEFKTEDIIREHFISYILNALKYKTPEGHGINHDTTNEESFVKNNDVFYGAQAWVNRFIERINAEMEKHPNNKFLIDLQKKYTKKGEGYLSFSMIANITPNDATEYEWEFNKLKEGGEYTQFQYDFIKYAAIAQGLGFSSSFFGLVLPTKLYHPFLREYENVLDNLVYDESNMEKFILSIKDNFEVQLLKNIKEGTIPNIDFANVEKQAIGNGDEKRLIPIHGQEKVIGYEGIVHYYYKVLKKVGTTPNIYVKDIYNNILKLINKSTGETDSENLFWYYQRLGQRDEINGYTIPEDIEHFGYDINKAFDPHYTIEAVKDPNSSSFISVNKHSVGKKIRLKSFFDSMRTNMVEWTIASANPSNKKKDETLYRLTNPKKVDTINESILWELNSEKLANGIKAIGEDDFNKLTLDEKINLIKC